MRRNCGLEWLLLLCLSCFFVVRIVAWYFYCFVVGRNIFFVFCCCLCLLFVFVVFVVCGCYSAGISSMRHGLREIFSCVPSLNNTSTSTAFRLM